MSDSDLYGDSVYEQGDAVEDTDEFDPTDELTGDDPDEEMQTGFNPPDREPHNLRSYRQLADEPEGESLDERLAEEEPDVTDVAWDEAEPRAGRLVAPDEGAHADDDEDEVAADVGTAGYGASAEEAAMHVVDDDRLS